MSNDTHTTDPVSEPIGTYAEHVAAWRKADELVNRHLELRHAGDHDEAQAFWDQYVALTDRIHYSPEAELFRCLRCVDRWHVVDNPDDLFQPCGGVVHLEDEPHEAPEVVKVGRTLAAELRRLRPELVPTEDGA